MVGGSRRPVGGVGEESWAAPDAARGQCHPLYKSEECSPWCRSLPLPAPRRRPLFSFLPISCRFSLVWDRKVNGEPGADGVQLRRHRGGGGQVPRPRPRPPPPPQQQHDAVRRGGVAQDDAEELVVGLVRPQPRPRRRAQVRLRAGHARRLLQVPPPPQQQLPRPRPRPPGVPSLPSHHLRHAAAGRGPVLLPHRRGAVTAPVSLNQETPAQQQ